MTLETILINLGYSAVFFLMILNGITNIPSSQILYLICGWLIFKGTLLFWPVLILGAIGNSIGNCILYEICRRHGKKVILNWIPRFSEKEFQKLEAIFKKHGYWFIFVGKLLPALKTLLPILCGFGRVSRVLYNIIIIITSFIWAAIFLILGYYFGKGFDYGVYGIVLVIIAILLMYFAYKYYQNFSYIIDKKELKPKKQSKTF